MITPQDFIDDSKIKTARHLDILHTRTYIHTYFIRPKRAFQNKEIIKTMYK